MDNEGRVWVWIVSFISAALITLILSIVVNLHYSDVLIAHQNTCYGKVIQASWNSEATEILAIQACDGQVYDSSVN